MCAPRGSLSKRIRSIPAAQSEYAAITGQDPCMLAQLAYKDAQRAATIRPSWAKCFLLQVTSACARPHACQRRIIRAGVGQVPWVADDMQCMQLQVVLCTWCIACEVELPAADQTLQAADGAYAAMWHVSSRTTTDPMCLSGPTCVKECSRYIKQFMLCATWDADRADVVGDLSRLQALLLGRPRHRAHGQPRRLRARRARRAC